MRLDSQGGTTITMAIVLGTLTFVVIALRLFSRSVVIQHIGPDDGKFFSYQLRCQLTGISLDQYRCRKLK